MTRLAEHGDADAQFHLGVIYYIGADATQDHAAAAKWYRLAAEQGHANAQYNLGYMSAEGQGTPQNDADAVKWYRLSAEQGNANAQNNLGGIYEKVQDYTEAAKWYGLAARQGHMGGQVNLAYAFSNGRGVQQDEAEAVKWYRLSAEQGDAIAQSNLGGMYMDGRGVPQDYAKAAEWLRLAAKQGFPIGQSLLGELYADGYGVQQNYEEALKWHRLAAEQGDVDAQLKLGFHYDDGHGVAQDKVLAHVWFALAAAQGNAIAAENLDRIGSVSDSEIDDQIAKAVAGDSEAQRNLAACLNDGEGIQRDQTAAKVWIKMAAEGGDAVAQTIFAVQLRATKDPDNERESVRWLSLATDQGDQNARCTLGLQQFLGIGTPIDQESAAVNLIMASLAGADDAKKVFDEVRPNIPDQCWENIFERVQWPGLTFLMGPLMEGHLDGIRQSQENDDWSDDALWLKYERESASIMFPQSEDVGSILDSAFGEQVRVRKYFVGRSFYEGKPLAGITISTRDIILEDDFPVYWKPSDAGLEAVAATIGFTSARDWIRHIYFHY